MDEVETMTEAGAKAGEAVGRAVRASLVSSAVVVLFVSLAVYGQTGNFNLSG